MGMSEPAYPAMSPQCRNITQALLTGQPSGAPCWARGPVGMQHRSWLHPIFKKIFLFHCPVECCTFTWASSKSLKLSFNLLLCKKKNQQASVILLVLSLFWGGSEKEIQLQVEELAGVAIHNLFMVYFCYRSFHAHCLCCCCLLLSLVNNKKITIAAKASSSCLSVFCFCRNSSYITQGLGRRKSHGVYWHCMEWWLVHVLPCLLWHLHSIDWQIFHSCVCVSGNGERTDTQTPTWVPSRSAMRSCSNQEWLPACELTASAFLPKLIFICMTSSSNVSLPGRVVQPVTLSISS